MSLKLYYKTMMMRAWEESRKSPDPSTKVGVWMVDDYGAHVGSGYNHLAYNTPYTIWGDRERKYQHVIHAEMSALLGAGTDARDATMFVTHHPCAECAKHIGAMRVRRVVCPEGPWRDDPAVIRSVNAAKEILKICCVSVDYYKED